MGCCCSEDKGGGVEERRFLDDHDTTTHDGPSKNGKKSGPHQNGGQSSTARGRNDSLMKKGGGCTKKSSKEEKNPSFRLSDNKSMTLLSARSEPQSPSKSGHQVAQKGSASERLPMFQKVAYIGQGSFAEVTLARKISTGKLYAMKKIRKKLIEERGEIEHTVTERRLLGELQHPFLVQLHESFQSQQCLYLLLSYAAGGDCHALLSRAPRQSLKATFFYVYEVSLALEFLHQSKFLYRDLKPENILIDEGGHVLLTDFGVAKKMSTERTASFCGTLLYAAPEVHKNESQTFAVDWWSLGCFIFEMINGRRPFGDGGDGEMQQIQAIVERDVIIKDGEDFSIRPEDYSTDEEQAEAQSAMEALKDLTLHLMCRNPEKRLGGADVFLQPFFHHRYFSLVYADSLGQTPSEGWLDIVEGKGLAPPFKPTLASSVDVQYFTQACPVVMSKKERLSVVTRSAATSVATVGNASMRSHTLAPYFDVDDDGALMMEQGGGGPSFDLSNTSRSPLPTETQSPSPILLPSSLAPPPVLLPMHSRSNTSELQYRKSPNIGGSRLDDPGMDRSRSTPLVLDDVDEANDRLNHRAEQNTPALSNLSYAEEDRPSSPGDNPPEDQYYPGYTFNRGPLKDEESDDGDEEGNDLLKYRAEQNANPAFSNLSYAEEDRPSFTPGNEPPSHYYAGYTFKEASTIKRR